MYLLFHSCWIRIRIQTEVPDLTGFGSTTLVVSVLYRTAVVTAPAEEAGLNRHIHVDGQADVPRGHISQGGRVGHLAHLGLFVVPRDTTRIKNFFWISGIDKLFM